MNWKPIITDLEASGLSLLQIAQQIGAEASGSIRRLRDMPGASCEYTTGCKIIDLHRRRMKLLRKQAAKPAPIQA